MDSVGIYTAVETGDIVRLRRLLGGTEPNGKEIAGNEGVSASALNHAGNCNIEPSNCALHHAVHQAQLDCTRILLGGGWDARKEDANGWSALSLALLYGDRPASTLLREFGRARADVPQSPAWRAAAAAGAAQPPAQAPQSTPYARFHRHLERGDWQLHVAFGCLETVTGTHAIPPLQFSETCMSADVQCLAVAGLPSRAVARKVHVQVTTSPTQTTSSGNMCNKQCYYTASMVVKPDATLPHCRDRVWTASRRMGNDQYRVDEDGWALNLHVRNGQEAGAAPGSAAATADAVRLPCDMMVFEGSSISDFDLRVVVQMPHVGDTVRENGQPTNCTMVTMGEAVITASMLTGATITSQVSPLSSGLENMATVTPSEQHQLPAVDEVLGDAEAAQQQMRLTGQLSVPLIRSSSVAAGGVVSSRIEAVGMINLRYQFVRGYSYPKATSAQQRSPSAADGTLAAAVKGAISSTTTVDVAGATGIDEAAAAIPAGGAPEWHRMLHASVATAAAAGPLSSSAMPASSAPSGTAAMPPSPLHQDFWKRTRIVGHRGSGADNAAVVDVTNDDHEEEGLDDHHDVVQVPPSPPVSNQPTQATSATDANTAAVKQVSASRSLQSVAGSPSGAASVAGSVASTSSNRRRRTHVLENTLLSLTSAAAAGVEYCEFDVQLTRDGIPVIIHDWTVPIPLPRFNFNADDEQNPRNSAAGAGDGNGGGGRIIRSPLLSPSEGVPPLRVPVTHLTLSQMRCIRPSAMTTENVGDEYELSKQADAADARFKATTPSRPARAPAQAAQARREKPPSSAAAAGLPAPSSEDIAMGGKGSSALGKPPRPAQPVPLGIPRVPSFPGFASESKSASADDRSTGPAGAAGATRTVAAAAQTSSGSTEAVSMSAQQPQTVSGSHSGDGIPRQPQRSPSADSVRSTASSVAGLGGAPFTAASLNNRTMSALGIDVDSRRVDATKLALQYHYGLRDTYCTLAEAFQRVPSQCGFNIEVKYATINEQRMFGLRQAERNAFVDRILDVVFAGCGYDPCKPGDTSALRPIMFSSFDPDVCLLLARKQQVYPVFFLTEGGTAAEPQPDPRMNSLKAAVSFAREAGLVGIVTHVPPILEAPRLIRYVQEENGLVLASYGRMNNDVQAVAKQRQWGVGAVIVDHVAHVIRSSS